MKKVIAVIASLAMLLSVAGCSNGGTSTASTADSTASTADSAVTEESTADSAASTADSSASTADEESTEASAADSAANEESAAGDNEFLSWDEQDMIDYMKAEGVFTNDDLLYVQKEGVEAPEGITDLISYIDDNVGIEIDIFYLQPDAPTARTEEIYNEIKTTKQYIMTEAGNVPFPVNLLIGRFAIFYSYTFDEETYEKCEAAIEKLIDQTGVQPDFYDKEIELPSEEDYPADDMDGEIIVEE